MSRSSQTLGAGWKKWLTEKPHLTLLAKRAQARNPSAHLAASCHERLPPSMAPAAGWQAAVQGPRDFAARCSSYSLCPRPVQREGQNGACELICCTAAQERHTQHTQGGHLVTLCRSTAWVWQQLCSFCVVAAPSHLQTIELRFTCYRSEHRQRSLLDVLLKAGWRRRQRRDEAAEPSGCGWRAPARSDRGTHHASEHPAAPLAAPGLHVPARCLWGATALYRCTEVHKKVVEARSARHCWQERFCSGATALPPLGVARHPS